MEKDNDRNVKALNYTKLGIIYLKRTCVSVCLWTLVPFATAEHLCPLVVPEWDTLKIRESSCTTFVMGNYVVIQICTKFAALLDLAPVQLNDSSADHRCEALCPFAVVDAKRDDYH
jgi:hypothetical protein